MTHAKLSIKIRQRLVAAPACAGLVILATLASSCLPQMTPARRLNLDEHEPVSMQEVTTSLVTRDQSRGSRSAAVQLKACVQQVQEVVGPLRQLAPLLQQGQVPGSQEARLKDTPAFQLANLTPSHCMGSSYTDTLKLIEASLAAKPGRIGLILPLGGEHAYIAQAVIKGAKAASARLQQDFSTTFVIKDSSGTAQGALHALAELVFYDDVALVVGGLKAEEAQAILPLAEGLHIPMLMINKKASLVKDNDAAFQVYPSEADLALTLASAAQQKNYKRIAILKPANGRSDPLVDAFAEAITARGLTISEELSYEAGDYTSMNQAVAAIARTAVDGRRGEYLKIMKERQKRAAEEHQPFDPRTVVLPAKPECDAVFIPDNYRNIRFFVKLFKYQGITKMPLIGNHHWRSRELLQPWDDFLEGAIFADFIGSYREIPAELAVAAAHDSEFFVPTDEVAEVDFQLLGYRSASIALKVAQKPYVKRKHLANELARLVEDDQYFAAASTFAGDHSVHWPTFVFGIANEKLQLEGRYRAGLPNATPSAAAPAAEAASPGP